MKYKASTSKISIVLLLLVTIMWFAGCVDERPEIIQETKNTVQFTATVPDIMIPSVTTRSMLGEEGEVGKEDEVQSVDILVFDASNPDSPEIFLEWMEGSDISQYWTSTQSPVTFSARLSRTNTPVRIVLVMNQSLSSIVSGFTPGVTTKVEVLEAMTTSSTEKWAANAPDDYRPIPMYGEVKVPKIHFQMEPIKDIALRRVLARIDILNNAKDFTVEEIYLANYNTVGYTAPAWESDGNVPNYMDDPKIPTNSGKQIGAEKVLVYEVGNMVYEGKYEGEIYTFEAEPVPYNEKGPDPENAVCLIVKGRRNFETPSYYRVDFFWPESEYDNAYTYLRRNFKYVIDIQGASGAGCASIAEAIASYQSMTNLEVRLLSYDRSEISNIVYNWQYMLGVSEKDVSTRQYESTREIAVFTDNPGGWKATIPDDGDAWLTFVGGETSYKMSNSTSGDKTIMPLKISYLNGAMGTSRSKTITLTAGRLTQEITVSQTVEEPGTIKFVDADGRVLENGLFFAMTDPYTGGDPEPQTFYVMWTSPGVKTWRHPRDEYGDGTPIEYSSITPDIKAGTANKTDLYNGIQAITVSPRSGNNDWRWDNFHFDLFDDAGVNVVGHEIFSVNQGLLSFKIDNYPTVDNAHTYALELGPIHTLKLAANVNWEIINVEEITGTGLLGTGQQDVSVGISNMIQTPNTPDVILTIPDDKGSEDGTDIVATEKKYDLNFPTGEWAYGKTGTVRVTFRNLMHTRGDNDVQDDINIYGYGSDKDDKYFPFYKTIDLVLTAIDPLTYTVNPMHSYFGVHPERYLYQGNAAYLPLSQAQQNCKALGLGWRIPNMSEALLASLYVENLGGLGLDNPTGWFEGMNYWTTAHNSNGDYRAVIIPGFGGTTNISAGEIEGFKASVRCVRDVSNTGYPYVEEYSKNGEEGIMIVSRDSKGGLADPDSKIFLTEEETVNETTNKMAAKLLVENTNTEVPTGDLTNAIATCANKGDGWRLPTKSEAILMMSVGMTNDDTLQNTGFDNYVLSGFTKMPISGEGVWTITQSDAENTYYLHGYAFGTRSKTDKNPWFKARCVKSIF